MIAAPEVHLSDLSHEASGNGLAQLASMNCIIGDAVPVAALAFPYCATAVGEKVPRYGDI